jgi:hypothetical protein
MEMETMRPVQLSRRQIAEWPVFEMCPVLAIQPAFAASARRWQAECDAASDSVARPVRVLDWPADLYADERAGC